MSIADDWIRIAAWYDGNTRPGKFRLNPGATPEAVAAFEYVIEAELPADFRESLLLNDGGTDAWILWHGELLTLDKIREQWEMYREWQANGDYAVEGDEDWTPNAIDGPIKPIFWNVRRLPITDNGGDHLALDLDSPPDGHYGQVIDHSHEVGPERVVAPSWSVFLSQLADDLEAGTYVYARREDTVALPGMYD
jgi:cell wall assembly regulator SMI1